MILLCCSGLLLLIACSDGGGGNPYQLKSGWLDLRDWHYDRSGTVALDGEWEFYWRKLLKPEDFVRSGMGKEYIKVPGSWRGHQLNGKTLDAYGFATFRARLIIPEPGVYGLFCDGLESAYKIWVNGKLVTTVGRVGTDDTSTSPQYLHTITPIMADDRVIDIIIQISNFRHFRGGIRNSIKFGTIRQIDQEAGLFRARNYFIGGIFTVAAVFCFILFSYVRHDKPLLYFGLFAVSFALYLLIVIEKIHFQVFPSFNWELSMKLICYTYLMASVFYMLFVAQLFPNESSKYITISICSLIGILCLIILVTDARTHMQTIGFSYLVILISTIYAIVIMVRALRCGRSGALTQLIPFVIYMGTVANDTLFSMGIIMTGRLMPYGVLCFVAWEAVFLSRRVARNFTAAQAIYKKLQAARADISKFNDLKQLTQFDTETQKVLARMDEIIYIQAKNSICYLHFSDEKASVEVESSIADLHAYFSNEFLHVHRSYLASLRKIKKIELDNGNYRVTFTDSDQTIPGSRRKIAAIKPKLPDLFR